MWSTAHHTLPQGIEVHHGQGLVHSLVPIFVAAPLGQLRSGYFDQGKKGTGPFFIRVELIFGSPA